MEKEGFEVIVRGSDWSVVQRFEERKILFELERARENLDRTTRREIPPISGEWHRNRDRTLDSRHQSDRCSECSAFPSAYQAKDPERASQIPIETFQTIVAAYL